MSELNDFINEMYKDFMQQNPGAVFTGFDSRKEEDGSITLIANGYKPATAEDVENGAEVLFFDAIVNKNSLEVLFSGPPEECELWIFRRAFTPILDEVQVALGETKEYVSVEEYIRKAR